MEGDVKQLVEKLNTEWTQFKSENDRRLKEVEKNGRADPLTEEKIDKHSQAIGELQAQLKSFQAKMNRPGAAELLGSGEKSEHAKAFGAWMKKGDRADAASLEILATKTAQLGVDADGGYAVPEELDRTIGKMEVDISPILGEVSSITTAAETYEKLFDLRGTTSGWVGETDARPETNTPQLASFVPSYGEIYAFPFATQKFLDDAFFNGEAWLAEGVAEKFAQDISAAIISGNGTNKPKGFLGYTLAATADSARAFGTIEKMHSGVSAVFTTDNLIDLMHKAKPRYRQAGKWLMASLTAAFIRKLKDSNGNYIWQPQLVAGQPNMLLGHAIVEDENMPAIGAASNSIIFGDLRRAYKFITVRGVRVLRDPYTAKPKVGFYTTQRVGGGVEDTSAIKVLSLQV